MFGTRGRYRRRSHRVLRTVAALVLIASSLVGVVIEAQSASADLPPLSSLTSEWVSVLTRANAQPLVLRHPTLLLVPTPIDVNGDAVPDLLVTLSASSTSKFTLSAIKLNLFAVLKLKLYA